MSADGKSFTFKGIDFGGASYNCYARLREFPRLPLPRVVEDRLAQADGSATQGSTFDSVRIVLECGVVGASTAAVETLISSVAGALARTQEGPGELIIDSHPTRAWTARLVSALDGRLGLNGETFTLEFLCADPWPHALEVTEVGPVNVIASPTHL